MKTNKQKMKRLHAEGKTLGEKRMWITRRQINVAKREQDVLRCLYKPTHVSVFSGGDVKGELLYGQAHYNGLAMDEAEKTLRDRKKQNRYNKFIIVEDLHAGGYNVVENTGKPIDTNKFFVCGDAPTRSSAINAIFFLKPSKKKV